MPTSSQRIAVGDDARDKRVSDKVERAVDDASAATLARVEQARDRTQSTIEETRDRAAERIKRIGGLLRTASEELRGEDADLARYADMAIDRVEQVAEYVGDSSVRTITYDLKELARTQPVPFFGGAFLVGFTVGRFLKNAFDASSETPSSGTPDPTRSTGSKRASPASERETPTNDAVNQGGFANRGQSVP